MILGALGIKGWAVQKNGWTDFITIYTLFVGLRVIFAQWVVFGVAMIAPALKFLVALFFLSLLIYALMRSFNALISQPYP